MEAAHKTGQERPSARLLKCKAAAQYLSVSPWQLRHLVNTGRLPVVQVAEGARFLFDVRDLDAFVERSKVLHYEL